MNTGYTDKHSHSKSSSDISVLTEQVPSVPNTITHEPTSITTAPQKTGAYSMYRASTHTRCHKTVALNSINSFWEIPMHADGLHTVEVEHSAITSVQLDLRR